MTTNQDSITVGTVTIPYHRGYLGDPSGWPLPGRILTQNVDIARTVADNINRISKPVTPMPAWKLEEIRSRI